MKISEARKRQKAALPEIIKENQGYLSLNDIKKIFKKKFSKGNTSAVNPTISNKTLSKWLDDFEYMLINGYYLKKEEFKTILSSALKDECIEQKKNMLFFLRAKNFYCMKICTLCPA